MKFQDVETIFSCYVQRRTLNLGHTYLQEQLTKSISNPFANLSRKGDKKDREKKIRITIAKLFVFQANTINSKI